MLGDDPFRVMAGNQVAEEVDESRQDVQIGGEQMDRSQQ